MSEVKYAMLSIDMQKLTINTWKMNKESSNLSSRAVNNLYGWAMSQNLPLNGFKWVQKTFQVSIDFIENYNEDSVEAFFPIVDVQYLEKVHDLHSYLPFLPEQKLKMLKSF